MALSKGEGASFYLHALGSMLCAVEPVISPEPSVQHP